jgi:hypothetical protein
MSRERRPMVNLGGASASGRPGGSLKYLVCLLFSLTPAIATADRIYNSGSGGTHDCNKDPKVVVNAGVGKYTITGTCNAVVINGAENIVTIEATKKLDVSGAENKIDIGALGSVDVSGIDNTINWKKGLGADKPRVSTTGTGNKINQVK